MIAAEGEHKASRALRHAAEVIIDSPAALQVLLVVFSWNTDTTDTDTDTDTDADKDKHKHTDSDVNLDHCLSSCVTCKP